MSLQLDPGDVFVVALSLRLIEGWSARYEGGEALDAFEMRHQANGVAALGMRNPEWLSSHFALDVLDASKAFEAGGRAVADLKSLTARYRASSRCQLQLQASIAWTNNPTTDQEAISPWFAVDKAMIF